MVEEQRWQSKRDVQSNPYGGAIVEQPEGSKQAKEFAKGMDGCLFQTIFSRTYIKTALEYLSGVCLQEREQLCLQSEVIKIMFPSEKLAVNSKIWRF